MSEPTAQQLLDILVRGLASQDYWLSAGILRDDIINLSLHEVVIGGTAGEVVKTFVGSPASCIAQLAAYEAEKRLTAPAAIPVPVPDDPSTKIATTEFVKQAAIAFAETFKRI